MVKILREADHAPVTEVAKKHGVSDVTIYACRKRFGKLEAVDVKRLWQLELENGRLKKLVAERDLDIEILKKVAVKNGERAGRRQQIAYVCQRGRSDGVTEAQLKPIQRPIRVDSGNACTPTSIYPQETFVCRPAMECVCFKSPIASSASSVASQRRSRQLARSRRSLS